MLLLICLCLFHLINNCIVLLIDKLPPLCDGMGFFLLSDRVLKAINAGRIPPIDPNFPPLLSYVTAFFMSFFKEGYFWANITVSLFLFILIFAVFETGKILYGKTSGMIAACTVSTFPIIFGYSRTNWLPVPTAAMTALSLMLLLRTELLTARKQSLLLGIVSGLALLTNWTFVIYFTAPFLFYLVSAYRHSGQESQETAASMRRKIVINAVLAVLLALLVSSPWYLNHFYRLFIWKFGIAFNNPFNHHPELRILPMITAYFRSLFKYGMHLFYSLIFIPCFLYFVFSRSKAKAVILTWFLIPSILYIISPPPDGSAFKTNRFLIPALVPAALMIASAIVSIKQAAVKKIAASIMVTAGLLQLILLTYVPKEEISYFPDLFSPIMETYSWQKRFERGTQYPFSGSWKTDEIISLLSGKNGPGKTTVLVLQNVPPLQNALQLYSYREQERGITVICPSEELDSGDPGLNYDFPSIIAISDFVIQLAPGYHKEAFNMAPIEPLLREFNARKSEFIMIDVINLPEGLAVEVYRRKDNKT